MAKNDNFSWEAEIGMLINKMGVPGIFSLTDLYRHKDELQAKYPDNDHIEDTIRATVQQMRKRGVIRFLGKGYYEIIK
jgi:hypothetical protein